MKPDLAIISDERFPFFGTDTQQIMKTAEALHDRGVNVEVVVPRRWRNMHLSKQALKKSIEDFYSIRARFRITTIPAPPSSLRSLVKPFHQLAAPVYCALAKRRAVYTRNLAAAFASAGLGMDVFLDTYRPLPDQYPVLGPLLRALALSKHFKYVTAHSSLAAESFVKAGLPPSKVAVVHNGYDPRQMLPRLSKSEARKRLSLPRGDKLVVYAGSISESKGLGLVFRAAALARMSVLVVGIKNDSERNWAEYEAGRQGLAKLYTFDWVAPASLSTYLYAADVLVIPPVAGPLKSKGNTVLPMKLFLYLAAARPIVGPDLPDTKDVLEDGRNCILVEPDSMEKTAQALASAVQNTKKAGKLAGEALKDSEKYTWAARAEKLSRLLEGGRIPMGRIGQVSP